jgi:hypothetical protein
MEEERRRIERQRVSERVTEEQKEKSLFSLCVTLLCKLGEEMAREIADTIVLVLHTQSHLKDLA